MQLHPRGAQRRGEHLRPRDRRARGARRGVATHGGGSTRSGGLWAEVMDELEAEIQQAGGTMTRGEGRFGPELSARFRRRTPTATRECRSHASWVPKATVGSCEACSWVWRQPARPWGVLRRHPGRLHRQSWRAAHGPGDLIPLTPPEGLESGKTTTRTRARMRTSSPSSADRRSPRPGEVPCNVVDA